MRKIFSFVIFLLLVNTNFGQTTLSAGDIAIFGVNADDPDDFGFVLLVDVQAGTEIRFTDSGWKSDNTFRGNEGAVKWTAPSNLSYGTEITYQGNNGDFTADNDATVGTNGFNLSGSGDQVFAFQGSSDSPTFIYAVQTNSNTWQTDATASTNSALPQGLTDGTNAVAVGAGSGAGDEYDNAGYDKANQTMSGTGAEILAAISDNSKWVGDNGTRYTLTDYNFTVTQPVPVELFSFTANALGKTVQLNWQTATEINNFGFDVERFADKEDANWEKIGFVQGHGNSNSPKKYSFTDGNIQSSGIYKYRLKQIDTDGSFKYSSVVKVQAGTAERYKLSQNYPNPFNPTTVIKYSLPKDGFVQLTVYDILGKKVATLVNANIHAGTHNVTFDASKLTSGLYFYTIQSGDFRATKKMALLK